MHTRESHAGPEALDDRTLDELASKYAALTESLRRVIVGQRDVIEQLLVALFCEGHTLIVGVPGLAKTLLVRSLAGALRLEFRRIQFTPDMMPSDVIGSEILQGESGSGSRRMEFVPGPIFANLVLADEINRTPPKTQAALLEAMAERQVSVGGHTRKLERPFVVVATQNPIEQEGTYPLPEAQLDRFMFGLRMDYPSAAEERRIVAMGEAIAREAESVEPLFDGHELVRLRESIAQIPVSEHVVEYAVALVRATRPGDGAGVDAVDKYVAWGAGPRTGQSLIVGAKCLAALEGLPAPGASHVRRLAPSALRHRLVLNYAAGSDGMNSDHVIERILERVEEPDYR